MFTTDTVYAGITATTNIIIGTGGTLFKTALTDCCTFRATVSAITNTFDAVTTVVAFCTPSV